MTTIPEPQEGLLDPFAGMMNADAAEVILGLRSSPEMQARAEVMAHKSREGQLTDEEQRQYESYADTVAMISLMQAHARRVLRQAGVR
jgi:hypothetical protein